LANTRSAIKRARQNPKRRLRNRFFTGRARTSVKKAFGTFEGDDPKAAQEATQVAIRALDKAAEKGILHKNNAARRKSRLMKHLNALGK
jgi:small subunit ribosomal protein S20